MIGTTLNNSSCYFFLDNSFVKEIYLGNKKVLAFNNLGDAATEYLVKQDAWKLTDYVLTGSQSGYFKHSTTSDFGKIEIKSPISSLGIAIGGQSYTFEQTSTGKWLFAIEFKSIETNEQIFVVNFYILTKILGLYSLKAEIISSLTSELKPYETTVGFSETQKLSLNNFFNYNFENKSWNFDFGGGKTFSYFSNYVPVYCVISNTWDISVGANITNNFDILGATLQS